MSKVDFITVTGDVDVYLESISMNLWNRPPMRI